MSDDPRVAEFAGHVEALQAQLGVELDDSQVEEIFGASYGAGFTDEATEAAFTELIERDFEPEASSAATGPFDEDEDDALDPDDDDEPEEEEPVAWRREPEEDPVAEFETRLGRPLLKSERAAMVEELAGQKTRGELADLDSARAAAHEKLTDSRSGLNSWMVERLREEENASKPPADDNEVITHPEDMDHRELTDFMVRRLPGGDLHGIELETVEAEE